MPSTVWCMPCLVIPPHHAQSVAWRCAVGPPDTLAEPGMWSTGPALHCSHSSVRLASIDYAACPYILQAQMALTSGALETCTRALGISGPYHTGMPAKLFFMLETRGPQGTAGHVAARRPPSKEAGFGATGHVALQSPPSRSRATVHMATPEPSLSGRRSPNLLGTWQPQSPPWLGGRIWCRGTRGDAWLHAPLSV
jgi:hypothetical protein